MSKVHPCRWRQLALISAALILMSGPLRGQGGTCRPVSPHAISPADEAYKNGSYGQAEQLYMQQLAQQPQDAGVSASLIETLLREDKVAQAAEQVKAATAANPQSAALLTAQADVQFRQGEPWLAMKTLDAAAALDPCYARLHLMRSRIFRIDSMYASQRAELQKAYDIDPTDPDILMAWNRIMPAAQEIEGTVQALGTMKDIDAQARSTAEKTVHGLMPLLYEDSQTCKVLPAVRSATLPLVASRQDGKHVDGYRLDVNFPRSSARLIVDTAASGLFISRAIADQNGFQRAPGAPMNTVQADTVRIGPLEFHDCMVGVSDVPFAGKADGFIGTDLLASYLITIDGLHDKLELEPLPPEPDVLPGNRAKSGELADYEPAYHRRQLLLVPVTINQKLSKLFVLDSGMRMTAMDSDTAHAVSNTRVNFTNLLPTESGQPAQVYRDSFDIQFAGLASKEKSGSVLEYDPAAMRENAGFAVAGLLGFDVLGHMTMHLDYRDGLIKLDPVDTAVAKESGSKIEPGQIESPECATLDSSGIPLNQTLRLAVTGTIDSAHLKPGTKIFARVVRGIAYTGCTLAANSIVSGRVTSVSSSRKPDAAELGLVFDSGNCDTQGRKPLSLHLIALLAPPDEMPSSLHGSLPVQVAGGGRRISDAAAMMDGYDPRLSQGDKPLMVHPGAVLGLPELKLDPMGGPACSARISSTKRSVLLGTNTELILALTETGPVEKH
jgi:hypothetical protein